MPRVPDCQWCGGSGTKKDLILHKEMNCAPCGGTGEDPSFDKGMDKYERELREDHEQYLKENA